LTTLYGAWFGLQREPFSIAPDPRTLFMSERHREALAHLLYGVQGGGGFVLLTGEIGAGKTTVSRCFLEQVPEGCRVAYVFNPKQSVDELLWTIAQEFGVQVLGQAFAAGAGDRIEGGSKALVDALNRFLLQVHAQGGQAVLVIDEAQALSAEVLEQLRLLTNLETSERKLLQIVLIGQPELRAMVASPGLEQLAQRVIARYHLGPLSAPDTARYVHHRLAVAGLSGPLPFDAAALKRVHERSRGVPRRINLLCDRALLGAYATGRRSVDAGIVERAAAEVAGEPLPAEAAWWGAPGSLRRTAWLAAGGLVLTLGAAALASALMRQT
jgi:general secretion pathway protein A